MKKIIEGFLYGILTAIIMIVFGGGVIALIQCSLWLFNSDSPGLSCLIVMGTIGFIIGVLAYRNKEDEK